MFLATLTNLEVCYFYDRNRAQTWIDSRGIGGSIQYVRYPNLNVDKFFDPNAR